MNNIICPNIFFFHPRYFEMTIKFTTNYNYTISKKMSQLNEFDKQNIISENFENVKFIGFSKQGKLDGEGFLFEGSVLSHCEFLNGKKNGTCIEYFLRDLSQVAFIGEYFMGTRQGFCKMYRYTNSGNTLIYEGYMEDNKYNGEGKLFENQRVYTGNFKNGLLHGQGRITTENGIELYCGGFQYHKYHDKGELYIYDDENFLVSTYYGEFHDGKMSGKGSYTILYTNVGTKKYNGQFDNDGIKKGCFFIDNHLVYDGEFKNFNFHGSGILVENATIYIGQFLHGVKHGTGTVLHGDTLDTLYSGNFIKNCFQNRETQFLKLEILIEQFINSSSKKYSGFLKNVRKKNLEYYFTKKNYPLSSKNKKEMLKSILQFRFIEKSITTNSHHLYHRITKRCLAEYMNHHNISMEHTNNKKRMWENLFQSHQKEQENDESKYDFFGNEIMTPVLANDSHIYDKKSLDSLFENNLKVSLHQNIEIKTYQTFNDVQHDAEKLELFQNYIV